MHWELSSIHSEAPRPSTIPTALLSGYGVYTTFRSDITAPLLKAHLTRLAENAETLGLSWDVSYSSTDWIQHQITVCVSPSEPKIIRLTALADVTVFNDLFQSDRLPCKLLLSTRPLPQPSPPLALQSVRYQRAFPLIKSIGVSDLIQLKRQAQTNGYQDILLINASGNITEASTANFFAIDQNGALWTADPARDGCLPGITRQQVIELTAQRNMPVHTETAVSIQNIAAFTGAFLSNAVSGLTPVARIDDHVLPWPKDAQEVLKRLQAGLRTQTFAFSSK